MPPDGDANLGLPPILERKIKPDGTAREFVCGRVYMTPRLAVIRYVVEDPALFRTPISIPPGTVSDGWIGSKRPYVIYRMRAPGGELIAHRFDAAAGITIEETAINYRDLVLDWWVLPGDEIIEEDRDELAALRASGAIDDGFVNAANEAARTVLGRYRHIIDELGKSERRLGIWP